MHFANVLYSPPERLKSFSRSGNRLSYPGIGKTPTTREQYISFGIVGKDQDLYTTTITLK